MRLTPLLYLLYQFLRTWSLFTALITPSEDGFGFDTFHQSSTVVKSMMAQYEYLAATYCPKFCKNMSVSYGKLLLIPFHILLHGWPDGLSVDCKLAHVISKISKSGGAGGNPELWSIRGCLRHLAISPVILKVRDIARAREKGCGFPGGGEYTSPVPATSTRTAVCVSILKYMYGGSIGAVINEASKAHNFGDVALNGICLWHLQFWNKLIFEGGDRRKFYSTYDYDWQKSKLAEASFVSIPRVGSSTEVEGIPGKSGSTMLRIMVRNGCLVHT